MVGKKRRFPSYVVKKEGNKYKAYDEQNKMSFKAGANSLDLFKKLEDRIQIDIASYEKLHNNEMILPLDASSKSIKLDKIESEELTVGLRKYKKNII